MTDRTTVTIAKDPRRGVEVCNVGKEYRLGRVVREVVKECSFRIEPGKCTVMIGPSGAGKSTLIRLIAGFEKPTRGLVLTDGKPIAGPGRDRQVMFQESSLFPWMTTNENIVFGPKARGEYTATARQLGENLIRKVGLDGSGSKYPAQLSGGMQRRAELARALLNDPDVMILDEPFRGLDSMTRKIVLEYYGALGEEALRTSFFVTTDVDEAIFLADRLLVMTQIPTRVRAVIEVDLPRPRRLAALRGDRRAHQLKVEVLSMLHEEAAKAFVLAPASRWTLSTRSELVTRRP